MEILYVYANLGTMAQARKQAQQLLHCLELIGHACQLAALGRGNGYRVIIDGGNAHDRAIDFLVDDNR